MRSKRETEKATTSKRRRRGSSPPRLEKAPTLIPGLDEITGGGLPRGRATLVAGAPGCGKTLLATEFLARGALDGEPGVFVSFEETPRELGANAASLGVDLEELQRRGLLVIDHVRVERSEIRETGEYDLEALFLRIGHAIDSVGARRIGIDSLEILFAGLANEGVLRAELRRLFHWLKDREVTAVITAERGSGGALTRHGLEEYISDCVIALDHRVNEQVATRRLRVVKYRGSTHGTNEYPFLIGDQGIVVLPLASLGLGHEASSERVPSGVPELDAMLGGGVYRGSTVLISGTAGTGKTSIAASYAASACERGETALLLCFEESPDQLVRNMRSIGIDLRRPQRKNLLRIVSERPTTFGIEEHLVRVHRLVEQVEPDVVVLDPVTALSSAGSLASADTLVTRLVDLLKTKGLTTMLTSLTGAGAVPGATEVGISSLADTWLQLGFSATAADRYRTLYILKSRGMPHSHREVELHLTDRGIRLREQRKAAAPPEEPGRRATASDRSKRTAKRGEGR